MHDSSKIVLFKCIKNKKKLVLLQLPLEFSGSLKFTAEHICINS